MSKKRLLIAAGLTLAFAVTIFLGNHGTVTAGECSIIRILEEKGSEGRLISIAPATLSIAKGSCVIWINWVPKQEVKVIFREEGKKCQDATSAPVGFKIKMPENCYVTDSIPLGGTSSLVFNQEGSYKYEIIAPGHKEGGSLVAGLGEVKGAGEIIVH